VNCLTVQNIGVKLNNEVKDMFNACATQMIIYVSFKGIKDKNG